MKIETKRKVIQFIKRVLRYYETHERPPFQIIEERKVQLVRHVHQYPERELQLISVDQIRYASNQALIDELEKNQFIKYDIDYKTNRVTASLKVILP